MLQILVRISVLSILFAALCAGAPSYAQQSLSDVLEAIKNDRTVMAPEDSTQKSFQFDFENSRNTLEEAREELKAAEQRGAELESWVRANEARIAAKNDRLRENARAFGELLGQFRYAAGKTRKKFELSLAMFEYPNRTGELKRVAEARTLPTRADLDVLPNAILTELRAQSEVKIVRLGNVMNASTDGSFSERELIRVGTFFIAAADTGEYVNRQKFSFLSENPYRLVVFPGEPVPGFYADTKALSDAAPGEVVRIPFDQKRGALFNESLFGPREED